MCPYHAARRHADDLQQRFFVEEDPDAWEGLPLFPTEMRNAVSTESMVALVDANSELLGEPLANINGQRRFGKHSWRALVAVFVAETGVGAHKSGMMGRWH